MNIYLADGGSRFKCVAKQQEGGEENAGVLRPASSRIETYGDGGIFKDTNILQSFYYCGKDDFAESVILPNCKRFMLDSGAFTFFSTGGNVDWDDYIRRYAAFVKRNNIDLFFELDIDALIGYDKVLYYRAWLEDAVGKPCIPVWHFSRGKEKWLEMCEQYPYVAIGGLVSGDGAEYAKRFRKFFPWFINTAHESNAKIHALGFTALKALEEYRFDSVDSSSWTTGNRFGHLYKFNGRTIVAHKRKDGTRIADSRRLALHNFNEWVKFMKYAEIKL